MKISIGNHEFTELWDKVLYKALSDYPNVSDNEMKDIIDFTNYEKANNRNVTITADRKDILDYVLYNIKFPQKYKAVPRPKIITECTACKARKGCMTDFVCHTAPYENAVKIFECGSLLSAVKARKQPAEILMKEKRNAACDPADFFEYVMFTWGNCQAGDRLVMERKLKRSPTPEEMENGFTCGIRFYFKYSILEQHPQKVHDGFLPIKVKDEVVLNDYVYAVIVPLEYKTKLEKIIPKNLVSRTYYLDHEGLDVFQWSEKVYSFVKGLN